MELYLHRPVCPLKFMPLFFDRFLDRQTPALVAVLGIFLLAVVSFLDYLTGHEISFSIFYLLPIVLVTWHSQPRTGYIFCFAAAMLWLLNDSSSSQIYSNELIPIWNMSVRLCFFLLMTYLLAELQKHEQRRRALERIFFHDILNIVGSVRGYAELLKDNQVPGTQEVYNLLYQGADRSLEDIEAQRVLANAENDELYLEVTSINSQLMIKLIVNLYQNHEVSRNKTLSISKQTECFEFESDQSLLSRVLGNMLKNALESTAKGGVVSIGCCRKQEWACFWVHNQETIDSAVQKQIFKQTISTKGKNRGIGTYSMKLLTDCLQGRVSFSSNEQEGTTFEACYPVRFPKTINNSPFRD